jgi:hypothetical protein
LIVRRTAAFGLLTLLALPAAAAADAPTGGVAPPAAAIPAAPGTPAAPADAAPAAEAGAPTTASAELTGAGTWTASPSSKPGRPVKIAGTFHAGLAGRTVQVQRRTPAGRWARALSTKVRSTGTFSSTWKTSAARVHELRVVLDGERAAKAGSRTAAATSETVTIAVLGRAKATWYGPGFYGRTTACGVKLRKDTVGIAHRTLPCGTQVEVRMGGRSVVAPVIDRGPFANGASLDLTKNAADDVGLDGVGTVSFLRRDDLPRLKTPGNAPAMR